ncbi:hypothetical protein GCM10023220_54220 [Streptomyces ziwulingensis]|uniref:Uncharacterized protein n=1 Tax=Streptomyces ziwulingensis TaxID=1045501 RepID=A0ABP9CP94_9ACTN
MTDRAAGEEHDDVEVDAVHAVQGGLGVPDAAGAHGADLHADAEDAQIDREGEGSDPAAIGTAATGIAAVATGAAAVTLVAVLVVFVRHVLLVPSASRARHPRCVSVSPQADTPRPSL